ncbi:Flavonoid 3'5'-hydroxylase [Quillaja saponaria]|uniref:Flavonoid 3'5'-hydroxylase n=1 Tax=Quillaja saponaria TaxID=32244 RepID=A0AAD7LVA3_QUISA|nr:Flavonoid 3'5'-hydroxylase [Quillaja saponaria]
MIPLGPKGWPILGALPLLGNMPHVTLAKLAEKFGSIMHLKLGTCSMVVASTPDSARAFLQTFDQNFSNRPTIAGATHLGYNSQDMVFSEYGPKWKLLRISNLHMFGGKAIENWAEVPAIEVGHMVRAMYESSKQGKPVVVGEVLVCAITNMVGQVLLSRRVFDTKGSGHGC